MSVGERREAERCIRTATDEVVDALENLGLGHEALDRRQLLLDEGLQPLALPARNLDLEAGIWDARGRSASA
jgi:hypothetical protein